MLTAVLLLAVMGVTAKPCRLDSSSQVWKHNKGSFKRQKGTTNWVEHDENGAPGSKFVQTQTEGSSIVIFDKEREVSILLREDLAGIRGKGEGQFQQLYQGSFVKSVDCT